MSEEQPNDQSEESQKPYRPLRVWPAVILVLGMVVARWIPTLWEDGPENVWMYAAFGPAICGIAILLWWITTSRATWKERLVGFIGCLAALGIVMPMLDKSFYGPAFMILTIPLGTAMFGLGAALFSRRLNFGRTTFALLLAFLGFAFSGLLRNDGLWGDFALGLDWRWNASAEEQLIASKASGETTELADVTTELASQLDNAEWPCFRGADRTSTLRGVRLDADWEANPPEELWKISVGPGWSSFAVAGNLLFTQEQRGPMECVVCYSAETGKEIWSCEIESRFEEAIAGPGPRATPTIAGGQIYGRSDMNAAFPAADACGPADLHATIFHALGIDPNFHLRDIDDRPLAATDGKPLPLFA